MGSQTRAKDLNKEDNPKDSRQSRLILVALALSSLACLTAYLLFFRIALAPESSTWAIEYEGPCLWASTMIARGLNPYPPEGLMMSPFQVIIYPPLYFQICSLFLHGKISYFWPRVVSIAATFISAIFYYLFAKRIGQNKVSAWLAALLFMSFMAVWLWSCKGRVDALSIALSLVALYFYGGQTPKSIVLSALTLALAALSKQPSALLAPALCIDLLCRRQVKQAFLYGGTFALTMALAVLFYQDTTSGGFIAHMRFASHMPYVAKHLIARLELMKIDLLKFVLAFLATGSLVLQFFKKTLSREQKNCLRLSLLLLLCTVPATFYTAGTAYSNINHFLVTLLPLPLLIITPMLSPPQNNVWQKIYQGASIATGALSALLLLFLSWTLFAPGKTIGPNLTNKVSQETFSSLVKGKTILAEDAGYSVIFGCQTEPVDITTFLQVLGADGAQSIKMKTNIAAKKYAAVIINHKELDKSRDMPQWSESLKAELAKHYRLLGQINGNNEGQDVFVPR